MPTVLFTDKTLAPIGQPISSYIKITGTLRFNQPDTVQVSLPALGPYIEMAQPGNRLIVVDDDGKDLVAGPIEYPATFSWSADGSGGDGGPGLLTITSTDDSVWFANRRVYPDPAHASTAQTVDFYTLTSTNAEVAMRDLVNLNAGPGALAGRRIPNLVLGTLASVGTNVSVSSRFDALSDELRAVALAGGGLGFKVVEDGGQLKFVVYQPADLSASIIFSRGLRNIRSIGFQSQAPTATVALVGGDGTGTDRTIVERSDDDAVAAWGRIETWVNETSDDDTDLEQAGDQALANGAEQAQLTSTVIDAPSRQFGVHYNLGDMVSEEVWPGLVISDVITAVTFTADETGLTFSPQIGTGSASADPVYVRMLRDLDRRIGTLERT